MCQIESDSNPHNMLLYCQKSKKLWSDEERWINHLGVRDYTLTENSIKTGDINKGRLLSIIILFAKITIYNAKIREMTPNFFNFKKLLKINTFKQSTLLTSQVKLMILRKNGISLSTNGIDNCNTLFFRQTLPDVLNL